MTAWIIDREAYEERVAIMLVEHETEHGEVSHYDRQSILATASDSAYKTAYSIAATAAVRGDWEPAKAMCRRERDKVGKDIATELWRAIQRDVGRN